MEGGGSDDHSLLTWLFVGKGEWRWWSCALSILILVCCVTVLVCLCLFFEKNWTPCVIVCCWESLSTTLSTRETLLNLLQVLVSFVTLTHIRTPLYEPTYRCLVHEFACFMALFAHLVIHTQAFHLRTPWVSRILVVVGNPC